MYRLGISIGQLHCGDYVTPSGFRNVLTHIRLGSRVDSWELWLRRGILANGPTDGEQRKIAGGLISGGRGEEGCKREEGVQL